MKNNDLTLQTFIEISKKMKKKENFFKNPEIFHDGTSASSISEFFALALTSLKKRCALARAHHMTSARSEGRSNERRSPKLWVQVLFLLCHIISKIHWRQKLKRLKKHTQKG